MKTRLFMLVLFVLALAAAALAADNPFVGTYKENASKTKANSGRPDRTSVVTFTAQQNGLKLLADGVDPDGNTYHVTYVAKFDGNDYPVSGMAGMQSADTVAIERIDPNTFSELFKKNGKEIFSARLVISSDGKTLTRTTKEKDAQGKDRSSINVYDRQ